MTLKTRKLENFRSFRWGDEPRVKRAQTVSEDPHQREWKFSLKTSLVCCVAVEHLLMNEMGEVCVVSVKLYWTSLRKLEVGKLLTSYNVLLKLVTH